MSDDKLFNITNINNDIKVTINNNHWTFYPIRVSRGNNYKFNLQLHGEYIITTGTYIVSHKKWFDGSYPNYRCALNDIYVPDICQIETKQPTISTTTNTNMPTIQPTTSMVSTTIQPTDNCRELGNEYCEQKNVEWKMAHESILYSSLYDTTTIAWTVYIERDHWNVQNWCFPQWISGQFNYPETLKRFLIRFNKCCVNMISKQYLVQIIDGVSDEGNFEIIENEMGMVNGLQWNNIYLKKGKTAMFFITFKGNLTLIESEYWFFGANKHSRCYSNDVNVPDICYAFNNNNYVLDSGTESGEKDWYMEWLFLINCGEATVRRLIEHNNELIMDTKQWIENNNVFVCDDWINIINIKRFN